MTWDQGLEDDFERIARSQDRHARGIDFENLLARLFRASGFRVHRSPKTARPRQTDLLASRGTESFLIEAKWTKAAAGPREIDDLRSRLGRAPSTITGVLFSVGGFTTEAIRQVELDRTRMILLFDPIEIPRLFRGGMSLISLLNSKKESLIHHGRAYFEAPEGKWSTAPWPDTSKLPSADVYLWHPSKGSISWQGYPGGFGHVVFTERLIDVGWCPGPGAGSSFSLDLPIDTIKDVAHVFDALNEVGWLSHAGRFCIQQSNHYWYGVSARECCEALQSPEPRYAAAKGPFHHTEEVTYVDSLAGGFFALSIDVRIGNPSGIGHAEISGQLYGVPVDTTEFQHLLRLLQLDDQLYFRSLERSPVRTIWRWKGRPIPLKPVSFLRAVKDDWVCGIVARNPFHKGRHLDQVGTETADYLYGLQDIAVVPFRLGQWHEAGDGMNYYLRGLEATSTSDALVFSLIANSVPRGKSTATRGGRNRKAQGT